MTTYMMTAAAAQTASKKDLLPIAKALNIKGRDAMPATELRALVVKLLEQVEAESAKVEASKSTAAIDPEVIKTKKRRAPSAAPRDEFGKVIRRGKNLSGNAPWTPKFYFLDKSVATGEAWQAALSKAPMQARLIIRSMEVHGRTDPTMAAQGVVIVKEAREAGILASKIGAAALFAYYARLLEQLGVREGFGL